jgi:hypothetical protein
MVGPPKYMLRQLLRFHTSRNKRARQAPFVTRGLTVIISAKRTAGNWVLTVQKIERAPEIN